ncbi:hypothetical protein [Streptomyces sp. NPDC047079]|uniref:hypothetical protein n=1 Tax=Streptomyces sp. NPDC047079 TaxID=3154607 RepID=UPI0033EA72AC
MADGVRHSRGRRGPHDRTDPETALRRLCGADLAAVGRTHLSAGPLGRITRLRCPTLVTAGFDPVDPDAAARAGLTVAYCPTYSRQAVVGMSSPHCSVGVSALLITRTYRTSCVRVSAAGSMAQSARSCCSQHVCTGLSHRSQVFGRPANGASTRRSGTAAPRAAWSTGAATYTGTS